MRFVYYKGVLVQCRPVAALLVAVSLLTGTLVEAQETTDDTVLLSLDGTRLEVPWNPRGSFVAVAKENFEDRRLIEVALQKIDDIDWKEMELGEAVQNLARATSVTFVLDHAGLEEAGVTTDQLITLHLPHSRLKNALTILLEPLKLDYMVKNGVLIITSLEKAGESLETRVYGVADLVRSPQFARVETVALRIPVPAGSRVVYGASLHQDDLEYADFDTLIDVITSTIEPDYWVDNGGSGSISGFRSSLIISQTNRVHEQVQQLLQQLRAAEGLVRVHKAAENSAFSSLSE